MGTARPVRGADARRTRRASLPDACGVGKSGKGAGVSNAYGAPVPPPPSMMPAPAGGRPPRPRAWGWWLGGGLLVLAVVVFVVGLVASVGSFAHSVDTDHDTVVRVDGVPHPVSLPDTGTGYLWNGFDAPPDCTVTDRASGRPLTVRPVHGTVSKSDDADSLGAFGRFDAGSGRVLVTCVPPAGSTSSAASITVGPDPHIGRSVALIMLTIFGPLALGLAGVVVLIVMTVLWATRPPRPRPVAGPGAWPVTGPPYAGNHPPPPGISRM